MATKPTRKLRPAQSLREKSEAAKEVKPPKKGWFSKVRKAIAAPFKRIGATLGRYKAFRFIGKCFKFVGRIIVPSYFRSSWQEIKLVTWPTRRESRRLTMAVIGFAIVFGTLVATLDYGLGRLFRIIILGKHN